MLEMLSVLVLLRGCSSPALTDFIVTGKKKEKQKCKVLTEESVNEIW
jgi:hypothetical protein